MTKKLPNDAKMTSIVKNDIERTLTLTDTINGKIPLGGTLGKQKQKTGAINTTKDFDQFLQDVAFLVKNHSKDGKQSQFSIQRLKGSIADLRNKK
jgi:hypothetical protein